MVVTGDAGCVPKCPNGYTCRYGACAPNYNAQCQGTCGTDELCVFAVCTKARISSACKYVHPPPRLDLATPCHAISRLFPATAGLDFSSCALLSFLRLTFHMLHFRVRARA